MSPRFVDKANKDLANLQTWLDSHGINVHIQKQGQTALQTLQKNVLKRSGSIVSFSRDLLTQLVTIAFDLVLVLVLSIYLLVYGKQIGELVAADHAAGRRHARRTTTRCWCSTRCSATSAGRSCSA